MKKLKKKYRQTNMNFFFKHGLTNRIIRVKNFNQLSYVMYKVWIGSSKFTFGWFHTIRLCLVSLAHP